MIMLSAGWFRERTLANNIVGSFLTADQLLEASEIEIERALLRYVVEFTSDKLHPMTTCGSVVTGLFGQGGYVYDARIRGAVETRISRAWKALEDANLIEPPDIDNGRNGYRVVANKGRVMDKEVDFEAAKVRSGFTRSMFHRLLPDAAWNAFRNGDYDTAVCEAFRGVESAVRKKSGLTDSDHSTILMTKAFNPENGPLTNMAVPKSRREARRDLFKGALGELRNPKAHGDPTITDTLTAVEEMMTASALLRILDGA